VQNIVINSTDALWSNQLSIDQWWWWWWWWWFKIKRCMLWSRLWKYRITNYDANVV